MVKKTYGSRGGALSSCLYSPETLKNNSSCFKIKRKAFSIAEMAIAMVIGSIILGMAAPMITKQMKNENIESVQLEIIKKTLIPSGAIMFFDRAECPDGWTALNSDGAFIRDIGGEADERGVIQECGVPNLKGWNGVGDDGRGDGVLFKLNTSIIGGDSGDGGNDLAVDFDASRYSSVYKDGLNEVRPKNIAYLACKKN